MNTFYVQAGVNLDELADVIASRLTDDEILEFIEMIDGAVCDLGFTKRLKKLAQKIIKAEEIE